MTAHETTPSDAAIGPLVTKHVEAMTLHWNGIPVLVTGVVSTHFANWKLIGLPMPDRGMGTDDREIEQGRGALPELPEPYFSLRWDDMNAAYYVSRPNLGNTECYTRDQLIAYGEACRRMGNRDE